MEMPSFTKEELLSVVADKIIKEYYSENLYETIQKQN